jgi:glycerophosphoryl diester phosphodiesterase
VPFLHQLAGTGAPIAMAHRGYAPDGCENTMAAFERAVALGFRYLETDVRVTADGVALAFHDTRLDRVTDRRGRVAELPWQVVRRARVGAREPIARLDELLDAWPDVCVNIDVKSYDGIAPTVAAIRRTGTVDRVCVGAFSGARVLAMRTALGPQLCTALSPREVFALSSASRRHAPSNAADRIPRGIPLCVQVPARLGRAVFVDHRLIKTAHRLDLPVHVWTVNERAEMQRLLGLGVDGIITDAAPVLRDVLMSRAQWPPDGDGADRGEASPDTGVSREA